MCIQTPKRPSSTHVALLGCRSFSDVRSTFNSAKENLGEILSAVEFMDKGAFEAGLKMTGGENVLGSEHDFYVLLETSGSCESHDREKVTNFLDHWMCNTADSEANGVLAQDETQLKNIWSIRESVGPSCSQEGLVYKYVVPPTMIHHEKTQNIKQIRHLSSTRKDVRRSQYSARSSLTRHKYNSCRGIRTSRRLESSSQCRCARS